MSAPTKVQAIGECMIELVRRDAATAAIGYSGDTYNASVYLQRVATQLALPARVQYLTGLGDDDESRLMRERWQAEGIEDDAIVVPGAAPGLYLISTDDQGERSFAYWRRDSAAARLFSGLDWIEQVDADLVYLSGISLQLMSEEAREALVARLASLRRLGTRVAFDSNFRPSAWPSAGRARVAMGALLGVTDIALVTLEDEIDLGTCRDVESCMRHLADHGVEEIVVKGGAEGAWVRRDDQIVQVPTRPVEAVDTTAAGDSFNGGYLAARLAGLDRVEAANMGNDVARAVVLQRGAIVDQAQMPVLCW